MILSDGYSVVVIFTWLCEAASCDYCAAILTESLFLTLNYIPSGLYSQIPIRNITVKKRSLALFGPVFYYHFKEIVTSYFLLIGIN